MHLLLITPHADEPVFPAGSVLTACRQWLEMGHTIRLLSVSPASSGPIDRSVHLVPGDPSSLTHLASAALPLGDGRSVMSRISRTASRLSGLAALTVRITTAQGVHLVLADRPDLVGSIAAWCARFVRGWPVVTSLDSMECGESRTGTGFWSRVGEAVSNWCRKRLFHASSIILVKDDRSARELIALGIPACRIVIIPQSVCLKEMPLLRPRFEYRRLFDSTDRWVLGTHLAGGASPAEQGAVLDAADIVQERGSASVVFWIVAEGEQRLAMERDARRRGLRNVRFVANVPTGALPDFISSCDGWLHLKPQPRYDMLMPALAMNVPVIVPNSLPGIDRIIDADAGLPMIEGDPDSLVDCVLELQDHPQGCRQGRAFVAAHHDAESLTARTLEILLQSALPETLPLDAPEPAVASEPDRTWQDAA